MAAYAYSAINAQGLEASGQINAPDPNAAREQLRIRGLLAELLEELPASGEDGVRTVFKAIKPKSLQIFSRQFATMIEAGLNVVSALVILEEQTEDRYLGMIIRELRADVEGGLLLSQAMARHPKIFSRLFIAMVEAGEAAGILDPVLDRVAILLGFGIRKAKRTEQGRQFWDRTKLRIPMRIGDTVRKITMARFSRTLSTLVASGVDIIKSLEITGQTAGNWVVEEALANVRTRVHEGVPIAQPLIESDVLPPMRSQLGKAREAAGKAR